MVHFYVFQLQLDSQAKLFSQCKQSDGKNIFLKTWCSLTNDSFQTFQFICFLTGAELLVAVQFPTIWCNFLIIIVVIGICCYYKYGYCYYCSPGKGIITFSFVFCTLSFGVLLDRGITWQWWKWIPVYTHSMWWIRSDQGNEMWLQGVSFLLRNAQNYRQVSTE